MGSYHPRPMKRPSKKEEELMDALHDAARMNNYKRYKEVWKIYRKSSRGWLDYWLTKVRKEVKISQSQRPKSLVSKARYEKLGF